MGRRQWSWPASKRRAFVRVVLNKDLFNWVVGFLRGATSTAPVLHVALPKGTQFVRHDSLWSRSLKPLSYLTDRGAPRNDLRAHRQQGGETDRVTPALKSIASSISFGPRIASAAAEVGCSTSSRSRICRS